MKTIVDQLLVLCGYIVLGFLCKKLGAFNSSSDKVFSTLLLKITLPSSIIASSIVKYSVNHIDAVFVLLIATLVFIVTPFLARLFQKIFRCDDVYRLMLTYPNLGFMGLPIINTLYGSIGLFYTSLFMIVFNLSIFSHGISVIQKTNSFKIKSMINPGNISALCAIVIFFCSIQVPSVLVNFFSTIGNITSPLAMITLGSTLASVSIGSAINDKMLYIFSVCKLVIWPLLIWVPLHYLVDNQMLIGITVILTSLPVAGNVTMLCISFDGNIELASKGTFISTLLSFVSIPIYMLIFSSL